MSYAAEVNSTWLLGGAIYGAERADAGEFETRVAFDFSEDLSTSAVATFCSTAFGFLSLSPKLSSGTTKRS